MSETTQEKPAVTRFELVRSLHNEALGRLQTAQNLLPATGEPKVPQEAIHEIVEAQVVIIGLQFNLHVEDGKGGELAKNLWAVYEFMKIELIQGTAKDAGKAIVEVIDTLVELQKVWSMMGERLAKGGHDGAELGGTSP